MRFIRILYFFEDLTWSLQCAMIVRSLDISPVNVRLIVKAVLLKIKTVMTVEDKDSLLIIVLLDLIVPATREVEGVLTPTTVVTSLVQDLVIRKARIVLVSQSPNFSVFNAMQIENSI